MTPDIDRGGNVSDETKRRVVTWCHMHLANPVMRRLAGRIPGQAVIETVGRRSGVARHTPVGGRLEGSTFWMVANHGRRSSYVRNIEADPRVRLLIGGRWWVGTAHLLPGDDPRRRLGRLPRLNSLMVRLLGTDLLTLRIDVDRNTTPAAREPGAAPRHARDPSE
jgi:deazaflavin-dependent oxidoreductase (nitroreductase family)